MFMNLCPSFAFGCPCRPCSPQVQIGTTSFFSFARLIGKTWHERRDDKEPLARIDQKARAPQVTQELPSQMYRTMSPFSSMFFGNRLVGPPNLPEAPSDPLAMEPRPRMCQTTRRGSANPSGGSLRWFGVQCVGPQTLEALPEPTACWTPALQMYPMVHGSATSLGCKLLNLLDLEHAPLLSAGLTAMLPAVPRLAGWQEVHKPMVLPESGSTHGQNQKRFGTSMDCRGTVHLGAGSCTGRVGGATVAPPPRMPLEARHWGGEVRPAAFWPTTDPPKLVFRTWPLRLAPVVPAALFAQPPPTSRLRNLVAPQRFSGQRPPPPPNPVPAHLQWLPCGGRPEVYLPVSPPSLL